MKTPNRHLLGLTTALAANPFQGPARPDAPAPDRPAPSVATAKAMSDRRAEALEHAWELGEYRFTAEECSEMSLRRLRRLCEEAFTALDSDVPVWGARDEYDVLSAELTARAEAATNRPTRARE